MQSSIDRRGYVQVAGSMNGLLVVTPQTLEDADEKRYVYYDDGGLRRPAPLHAALAPYLGQRGVRLDSAANLAADIERGVVRKLFTCPSQPEPTPVGIMIAGGGIVPWFGPRLPSSYAYNEGLLGFELGSTRRQRGLLSRARPASEVVFMTDGVPRTELGPGFIAWFPNTKGRCTLADCYTNANGTFAAGVASQFDPIRHHGWMNVVFADGHAETIAINARALSRAVLLAE
jgi:prepilin-type processing-associated H-X9-DG protein